MKKVALHGVPRSGTTWLGSIFDSCPNVRFKFQPLFSYKLKGYINDSSSKEVIAKFFDLLKSTEDDFMDQLDGKKNNTIPSFEKGSISHVVYKEVRYHNVLANLMNKDNEVKVIGIVRNPKSVLSSWYRAPKEFNQKAWDFISEWENAPSKNLGKAEEFNGYNKWKETLELFLRLREEYPQRFLLIKYSDLLNETEKITRQLFEFCELNYTLSTSDFIVKSKSKDVSEDAYSVFRTNQLDDKWKSFLPQTIVTKIDKDLSESGLDEFL